MPARTITTEPGGAEPGLGQLHTQQPQAGQTHRVCRRSSIMSTEDIAAGDSLKATAALAGRRVDTPHAQVARFPLSRVPAVRAAIKDALLQHQVGELVSSAACGADLLALSVAEELGTAQGGASVRS